MKSQLKLNVFTQNMLMFGEVMKRCCCWSMQTSKYTVLLVPLWDHVLKHQDEMKNWHHVYNSKALCNGMSVLFWKEASTISSDEYNSSTVISINSDPTWSRNCIECDSWMSVRWTRFVEVGSCSYSLQGAVGPVSRESSGTSLGVKVGSVCLSLFNHELVLVGGFSWSLCRDLERYCLKISEILAYSSWL